MTNDKGNRDLFRNVHRNTLARVGCVLLLVLCGAAGFYFAEQLCNDRQAAERQEVVEVDSVVIGARFLGFSRLDLGAAINRPWSMVCAFPPYLGDEDIKRILGDEVAGQFIDYPWRRDDQYWTLVLVGKTYQRSIQIPRAIVADYRPPDVGIDQNNSCRMRSHAILRFESRDGLYWIEFE